MTKLGGFGSQYSRRALVNASFGKRPTSSANMVKRQRIKHFATASCACPCDSSSFARFARYSATSRVTLADCFAGSSESGSVQIVLRSGACFSRSVT